MILNVLTMNPEAPVFVPKYLEVFPDLPSNCNWSLSELVSKTLQGEEKTEVPKPRFRNLAKMLATQEVQEVQRAPNRQDITSLPAGFVSLQSATFRQQGDIKVEVGNEDSNENEKRNEGGMKGRGNVDQSNLEREFQATFYDEDKTK